MVARSAQHFRIAPEEESDRTAVRALGAGVKTTGSRRVQRPLADFAEPPQSKRCNLLRRNSAVFCARSVSAGVVTRCFSPCLIFWCFWIKPKAQKKSEIDSYFLWESSVPSIRRLLRGAGLPPFDTKRWRQKCPQGTFVGIGRRFSLSGHARSTPFAQTRSGRSNRRSI